MDLKRIATLSILMLALGLALVHLRGLHKQSVYQATCLVEEERAMRQVLWEQQVRLSDTLESPQKVRRRIDEQCMAVCPLGEQPHERRALALGDQQP